MTFKFEILIFGQQLRMDINHFEFIYLPIMDEFHPMIYLFNPNNKWNSSMKNDNHPYEIIRLCRWINITLNFKFQAHNSKLKLHVHAQVILANNICRSMYVDC